MDFKYHGIILAKFDIAEADRIYTIYTLEEGKIRALGRGVRRPQAKLAGFLEPITYGEIFISKNQGRGNITGAITLNSFFAIKSDLESVTRVFYVFKILEKIITQQEKDEKVFNLLLSYLETLEELKSEEDKENRPDVITLGFLFKLLDSLGYKIEVEKCVSCGRKLLPANNFFDASQGGVMCQNCHTLGTPPHQNAPHVNSETNGFEPKEKSASISWGYRWCGGKKISTASIKLIRIFLKNNLENFVKIKAEKESIRNLKIIANESVGWVMN